MVQRWKPLRVGILIVSKRTRELSDKELYRRYLTRRDNPREVSDRTIVRRYKERSKQQFTSEATARMKAAQARKANKRADLAEHTTGMLIKKQYGYEGTTRPQGRILDPINKMRHRYSRKYSM